MWYAGLRHVTLPGGGDSRPKMATYSQWRALRFLLDKELVKEPQGNDGAFGPRSSLTRHTSSLCPPRSLRLRPREPSLRSISFWSCPFPPRIPWRDPAEMKSVRQKGSCYVPVSFRWALGVPSVLRKKGGSPLLTCCQMSEQSWASRLTSLDFNFLICKRGVK